MIGRRLARALCVVVAAFAGTVAAEDAGVPRPRRDPFAAPAAFRIDLSSPGAGARAASSPAPPWAPRIRGILAAGDRSIVDLEGVMLGIGDRIEGYRLIKVGEREAVFQKDGRRIVLRLPTEKEQIR